MKLVFDNVNKSFCSHNKNLPVLQNINLTVSEEEFIAIVGPSGCGKSTLLNMAAGLLSPTTGQIKFTELTSGTEPKISVVFQETGLLPWRNVCDNIAFGLEAAKIPQSEQKTRINYYLELTGLRGFESAYPHQLSGGMKQRVGIARALAVKPDVLLMDEPFSALDAQTRIIMQEELVSLWDKTHLTTIYVTHNIQEAVMLADKVVLLSRRPGTISKTITISIPRNERNLPANAQTISSYTNLIWQHISSDARAAFLEVDI